MSIGDALELAGALLILAIAAALAITIVGAAVIALQRRRDPDRSDDPPTLPT